MAKKTTTGPALSCRTTCRFSQTKGTAVAITVSPTAAAPMKLPAPGGARAPTFNTSMLVGDVFPSQRDSSFTDTKACVPGKKPKGWGLMTAKQQDEWAREKGIRPGKIEVAFYGTAADYKDKSKRFKRLPHGPAVRFCITPLSRGPLHPVKSVEEAVAVARKFRACVEGGTAVEACATKFTGPDPTIGSLRTKTRTAVRRVSRMVRRATRGRR